MSWWLPKASYSLVSALGAVRRFVTDSGIHPPIVIFHLFLQMGLALSFGPLPLWPTTQYVLQGPLFQCRRKSRSYLQLRTKPIVSYYHYLAWAEPLQNNLRCVSGRELTWQAEASGNALHTQIHKKGSTPISSGQQWISPRRSWPHSLTWNPPKSISSSSPEYVKKTMAALPNWSDTKITEKRE